MLLGQQANAELFGLSFLEQGRHSHVHVHMDHSAQGAQSYQKFKNVLLDRSRASFTGKIHVRRPAQKTQAYQLTQSLLLSPQVMTFAKPNLEIFADDVKASHGATIAQLDEEQMLYLQTRGISKEIAKDLLTQGFCQEMLESISIPSIRKQLQEQFCRSRPCPSTT
jgi:Fe-S cluster assembly protein SufD